ncbi:MAG: O-antigen ligase family protein [Bacteroidales bacterium]|nr:O-antigen ligase family protein [Bacteroidales bacterium]MDD3893153.1 O-antigen ligase family protein [Bacteroidales bacterium]
MKPLLPLKIHRKIFIGSGLLTILSLPFSKFTLTIALMVFTANWLLEGQWQPKWIRLKSNYSVFFFFGLYLSLVIGLLLTHNLTYGIKEITQKLPLLLIPLVFASTKPVNESEKQLLLGFFVLAIFVYSLLSSYIFFLNYWGFGNVRKISPFVSHIRLSLMVNISIAIVMWGMSRLRVLPKIKLVLGVVLLFWFVVYLFILQSLTGIVVLMLMVSFYCVYYAFKLKKRVYKTSIVLGFVLLWVIATSYLVLNAREYFGSRQQVDELILNDRTENGNLYKNNLNYIQYENGNLVWVNVCRKELEKEWNSRSSVKYTGKDKLSQPVSSTLIRYLASMGLNKDSVGVWSLSEEDVFFIEQGATNVMFKEHKIGFYPRLYQTFWEIDQYRTYGQVSGSSLVQRYVFARAGINIFLNNFWFGVGTGDLVEVFKKFYKENEPKLKPEFWHLSHNQFLTQAVQVGFFGLLIFILGWFYPLYQQRKKIDLLSFAFFIIITLSMLNEDTLQTHTGVSLAAFFYGLLFFSVDSKKGL